MRKKELIRTVNRQDRGFELAELCWDKSPRLNFEGMTLCNRTASYKLTTHSSGKHNIWLLR